ncbi:MAG: hypothetical protein N4A63_09040 [Vallitalea sp.]|nr:hypothetical protein [Vallitalea sp.]
MRGSSSRFVWNIDNPMVLFKLLIDIGLILLSIYVLILIIKVSKRGIKALEIYLAKNQDKL